MDPRARLFGLSCLVLCGLPAPAGDPPPPALAFDPAEGGSFRRSFREETSFTVDTLVQRIGDNEIPAPTAAMEGGSTRELTVVDTFVALAGGRPTKLERLVESVAGTVQLSIELEGEEEEHRADLESPFEGARVGFVWDDEGETYSRVLRDGEDEAEESVGRLREDLDLRGLLPPEDAQEGDRWVVEGALLRDLFAPGGALGLQFGYEPDGPFRLLAIEDLASASIACLAEHAAEPEGELAVSWTETLEMDGRPVALLELELEATLEHDSTSRLAEQLASAGAESERQELALRATWELEGEGKLLWDLELGLFRELELALEHRAQVVQSWRQPFGNRELEYETELALSGRSTLEAECAPR